MWGKKKYEHIELLNKNGMVSIRILDIQALEVRDAEVCYMTAAMPFLVNYGDETLAKRAYEKAKKIIF